VERNKKYIRSLTDERAEGYCNFLGCCAGDKDMSLMYGGSYIDGRIPLEQSLAFSTKANMHLLKAVNVLSSAT